MVQKNSGDIEEFSYEKLYQGIENAFGGIDISDKKLKTLVDNVHKEIKSHGKKVKSKMNKKEARKLRALERQKAQTNG